MTFERAEKKLKKIANGKYRSVGYERTYDEDGGIEQECNLYIAGGSMHTGNTWDDAFRSLKTKSSKHTIEKAPKVDTK